MKKTFLALFFAMFVLMPQKAEAVILWDWQFTNDFMDVGPTDSVTQNIRIFNNSTEGETLGFLSGPGSPTAIFEGVTLGGLSPEYSIAFPLHIFTETGAPILPGQTRDVDFVTYVPNGTVSDGHYFTGGQFIQLKLSTGGNFFAGLSRCFNWQVNSDESDFCPSSPNFEPPTNGHTVIPEPSTILLLFFGLGSTVFQRFLRK